MSSMKRKARISQISSITLLIIALLLNINGLRESAYFVITMIIALGVTLYWSIIEHKIKKQNRNKSDTPKMIN